MSLDAARPPRERVGLALASLGVLACLAAVWPAAAQHRLFDGMASVVPDLAMPKTQADILARGPALLQRYPSDARLHVAFAAAKYMEGDDTTAEREAREGLRLLTPLNELLSPHLEASGWTLLGETLADRDANQEARAAYDKAGAIEPAWLGLDDARGHLDLDEGALDQALGEATRAVKQMPSSLSAWHLLGDVRFARTNLRDARAAYDKAEGIEASAAVERMRALVRFYSGDRAGALADLTAAMRSDAKWPYGSLWLAMVLLREGQTLDGVAGDPAATGADWPAPVMRLFLGTEDAAAVLASAKASAPKDVKGHVCEAGFYAAEWDLVRGRREEAQSGFQKSLQDCPPTYIETWMARVELAPGTLAVQAGQR